MTTRGRKQRSWMTDRRAAVIGIVALLALALAVFGDANPFDAPRTMRVQVSTAAQLRPDNPVRVAGVRVGTVTHITPGPGATSMIEIQLADNAPAIHRDATVYIEPRLALEGNFAVRLNPGTPRAPELANAGTIPLKQTSGPVQFDQVLGVFDSGTRGAFQSGLQELAIGLAPAHPAAPAASGAVGLKRAVRELDGALGAVTQLSRAARGARLGDLTQTTLGLGTTFEQLARDPAALADIAGNTRRVSAALVASDGALGEGIRGLRSVLRSAPAALDRIDAALPKVRRFAVDLRPGLGEAPAALDAIDAFVGQLDAASAPSELPRVMAGIRPIVGDLPGFESLLTGMFPYLDQVGTCLRDKVVPAMTAVVPDRKHTTGRPAYQDFVHAFAGLSAANPSFDANGRILRAVAAGGEKTLTAVLPPFGKVVAGVAPDIQGVAPVWLGSGVDLPWEPGADCRDQELPDLTQRQNTGLLSGITEVSPERVRSGDPAAMSLDKALRQLRRTVRKVGA